MTLLDHKDAPAEAPPGPTPPTGVAAWLRDLGLGVRFAAGGGREGWVRTVLTAVGVGLGVALLLTAASAPHLLQERSARSQARAESAVPGGRTRGPRSPTPRCSGSTRRPSTAAAPSRAG